MVGNRPDDIDVELTHLPGIRCSHVPSQNDWISCEAKHATAGKRQTLNRIEASYRVFEEMLDDCHENLVGQGC